MASKKSRIKLWKEHDSGQWCWIAVHRDGYVVCTGKGIYKTKQAALKAIRMVQEMIRHGDIEEVENTET